MTVVHGGEPITKVNNIIGASVVLVRDGKWSPKSTEKDNSEFNVEFYNLFGDMRLYLFIL